MWDVPFRSGDPVSRVEVWSGGQFVESTGDFKGGSVTEKRVSGPRNTLSLVVEPSKQWVDWLNLPSVELRVFAGVSRGPSQTECPLGVFPVEPPELSLPAKDITISATPDRWQLIEDDNFTYVQTLQKYVRDAQSEEMRRLAAVIIDQTWLGEPAVFWDAPRLVVEDPWLMLDKSRAETLKEFATALSGEVFVDRLGVPRIQRVITQPGAGLSADEDVTAASVVPSKDDVYNQVGVSTTAQGIWFFPAFVEITDSTHPAHRSNIGRKRSLKYSSSLIFTRSQAFDVATSLLAKRSVSVGWSVSCLPDPSRMVGDICTLTTELGEFTGIVEEVTHPLGDGEQTVKLSQA